jgi:hypothetical protein
MHPRKKRKKRSERGAGRRRRRRGRLADTHGVVYLEQTMLQIPWGLRSVSRLQTPTVIPRQMCQFRPLLPDVRRDPNIMHHSPAPKDGRNCPFMVDCMDEVSPRWAPVLACMPKHAPRHASSVYGNSWHAIWVHGRA